MERGVIGTVATICLITILLAYFPLSGIFAYLIPVALWSIAAFFVWKVGRNDIRWTSAGKGVILLAFSVAVVQLFIMIDVGLITSFGYNPVSFAPAMILLNAALVVSALLAVEVSRAYIIHATASKRPVLALALVSLFFTFIMVTFSELAYAVSYSNPLFTVEFIGGTLIPAFTVSLFATYLAWLGGPLASIAYRGPLLAFMWFMPILPDLPWGFKTLIGVVPPMVGFIYVNYVASAKDFRKAGIHLWGSRRLRINSRKAEKHERRSVIWWSVFAIAGIISVWFSVGLFSVYPVVPYSGSMSPTLEVGDVAIIQEASAASVSGGDIIEYATAQGPIIHRVIEVRTEDSQLYFITKGDANDAYDMPVTSSQVRGKLIAIVPKVGWASILVKNAIIEAWGFFSTVIGTVTLAVIALLGGAYLIRRQRTQPHWKRSKRGGW